MSGASIGAHSYPVCVNSKIVYNSTIFPFQNYIPFCCKKTAKYDHWQKCVGGGII